MNGKCSDMSKLNIGMVRFLHLAILMGDKVLSKRVLASSSVSNYIYQIILYIGYGSIVDVDNISTGNLWQSRGSSLCPNVLEVRFYSAVYF